MVSQDDEHEQHPERHRGHGEEVNGNEAPNVVVEKRPPALRRWLSVTDHVLGDGCLRDIEPEFEQFTVDPRCSPTWVGARHLPDEFADLRCNRGSSPRISPAFPGPVQSEASPVPSDDSLGLHDGEDLGPVLPNPGQQGPKEAVAVLQMRTFDSALKDRNLLP